MKLFACMHGQALKRAARMVVPAGLWVWLRNHLSGPGNWRQNFRYARLKAAVSADRRAEPSYERCLDYTVHVPSGQTFVTLYEEIFVDRIYEFRSHTKRPVIVDCGSNIGMSILFFKHLYPDACITGFEADPVAFAYLTENAQANALRDVTLIHGAIGARTKTAVLCSDGRAGGFLVEHRPSSDRSHLPSFEVPGVSLRCALERPVDFLKIDIEGAEYHALVEAGDRLKNVEQMVIEYHHAPLLTPTLHRILSLLDDLGFDYLLWGKFGVLPPFRLEKDSWYDLLLYARQRDRN